MLQKKIYPRLLKNKEKEERRIIRAWSTGTSYGEEAYSLAILFLEALKEKISGFDIKVYGTDIDPKCIEKASAGAFESRSLKEVKKELLDKCFGISGRYHSADSDLKHVTRFEPHNLASDEFMADINLLLCRNVVIYFTKPFQKMVYYSFARALNKGGFLALGKVESMWDYPKENFEVFDNREGI